MFSDLGSETEWNRGLKILFKACEYTDVFFSDVNC